MSRLRIGIALIDNKLREIRLRWFDHIQCRPPTALVRIGVFMQVDRQKRKSYRPKENMNESGNDIKTDYLIAI